jgi:excisionase family DNA binding protein
MKQTTEPEKLLFRVRDAAAMLSLSRKTIFNLIGAGKLQVVRIGGRTLVKAASLQRLTAARRRVRINPSSKGGNHRAKRRR